MNKNESGFPANHYHLMALYNRWMNSRIYYVCEKIPDEERKRDMEAFFRSIHGTLNHILYGDIAWLERLRDNSYTKRSIDKVLFDDFNTLREEREKTDGEIIEWAVNLSPDVMNRWHKYTSNVDNKTRELPVWILASHMFNHQTHHRGQVTTLIKQLGYEPGVTDIPWMPVLNDNYTDMHERRDSMVEIISTGADNIIGCRIMGKIESDDMVRLTSVTEDKLKNNRKLRVYVEVEDLGGISFDAFFKDLKLALKHYRDFERKAVVTNHEWIRKITPVLNRIFPGIEARCFPFDEKDAALEWIKQ